jgi:hypothetical protein
LLTAACIGLASLCLGQTSDVPIPSRIRVEVTWSDPTWPYWYLHAIDVTKPVGLYYQHASAGGDSGLPGADRTNTLTNATPVYQAFDPNDPVNHPPYPIAIEINPVMPRSHYRFYLIRQSGYLDPNRPLPPPVTAFVSVWIGDQRTVTPYTLPVNAWNAELLDYTVPAAPPFALRFGVSTDPAAPYHVDKPLPTDASPITARIALGSIFSVQIVKNPESVDVTPVDSSYGTSGDTVAPAFETQANLFDASPLLTLSDGSGAAVRTLTYAAVHLGTVNLSLVPFATGAPGLVTVNLEVVRPAALGSEHNEWDARIIEAAHERGIPPQIIKGQIRQESPGFHRDELRYEPCSVDWAHVSAGGTLIARLPFSLYKMDDILSDGALTETVDLRNRFLIADRPGGVYNAALTRFIAHSDRGVTAREIWDANNGPLSQQGYDLGVEDQNWAIPLSGSPDPNDPDVETSCGALNAYLLNHTYAEFLASLRTFTAQTPTASSYGLMQVLYGTAVDYPIQWFVPNPARNLPGCPTNTDRCQSPRYLRDTPESLALHHGGSLFAGGYEDVTRYWDFGPASTAFASAEDFLDSFKEPLRHYTGGGIPDYGVNVVDVYEFDYLPVQPGAIFP